MELLAAPATTLAIASGKPTFLSTTTDTITPVPTVTFFRTDFIFSPSPNSLEVWLFWEKSSICSSGTYTVRQNRTSFIESSSSNSSETFFSVSISSCIYISSVICSTVSISLVTVSVTTLSVITFSISVGWLGSGISGLGGGE